jgi:hypothetical protein
MLDPAEEYMINRTGNDLMNANFLEKGPRDSLATNDPEKIE